MEEEEAALESDDGSTTSGHLDSAPAQSQTPPRAHTPDHGHTSAHTQSPSHHQTHDHAPTTASPSHISYPVPPKKRPYTPLRRSPRILARTAAQTQTPHSPAVRPTLEQQLTTPQAIPIPPRANPIPSPCLNLHCPGCQIVLPRHSCKYHSKYTL
ncbi:uncharacterized protein LOC128665166 [Bombina bombina]|uniref:uncharacterized protein LOC128639472 n=1 Tax=Bombina bombina TaxID=8345 RepID=UPI00235A977A|nr:uncharacterized protein LOC128639472 [Bombina bombina]XP_053548205.1 uncharacterized protein LOC128639952 [Bombina bombina]XP_053556455.1 uncharacterized protein LOC128647757 [Bombina bombina]XP_053556639.1 uncharacterized protein LOC128647984 [Bombina bombina]XP_053556655.1 uncharacterized protein LOC128647996 [Bombina bombina]XP_053556732.1 uncharacterized protein LOC128648091 [Bombina bombina]XP_053556832.1 uncharacterized protein LOC128648216 [Bombina bombina]XP_053560907.1 uncharacte